MQPHEVRVVVERDELDHKIWALCDFIGSYNIFKSLPEPEKSRLQVQLHYMQGYSHILHERVKNFPKSDEKGENQS
jgi:hypothetical protein